VNAGCERQRIEAAESFRAPFRERASATRDDVNAARLLPRSQATRRDNQTTGWRPPPTKGRGFRSASNRVGRTGLHEPTPLPPVEYGRRMRSCGGYLEAGHVAFVSHFEIDRVNTQRQPERRS